MAPQLRVTLVENKAASLESLEDAVSGPHSMLFTDPGPSDTITITRNIEQTFTKDPRSQDGTFHIEDHKKPNLNTTLTIAPKPENRQRRNKRPEEKECAKKFDPNETIKIDLAETNTNLTFLPIDKSSENLLHDSSVEVKRRRINIPEKPEHLAFSTPLRPDIVGPNLLRLVRLSAIGVLDSQSSNDVDSKRDSLEFDDSLGILTPGQIEELPSQFDCYLDGFALDGTLVQSPVEQSKCLAEKTLENKQFDVDRSDTFTKPNQNSEKLPKHNLHNAREDLPSPNLNSIEYSLGLINERILSNVTLLTDTTMNLDLPLDSIDQSKDFAAARLDQTPSPEDLPLDPTPIVEIDHKTDSSKSKTSCFVTSITSITSIDTGYQGDGEMSRPASRGADNSPLTRRPLPRPQPRRAQDPMTDSDFYTESDADNHEENPLRGDRRAQVIDGTLYGVDPQAAADVYVNNRENMDSSGIFTDLENNPSSRNEDDVDVLQVPDPSPSDTSTKTISENSQNQVHEIILVKSDDNPKKRNAPSPGVLSPSSVSSPRHASLKDAGPSKKYKMPRRDVPSKIKVMLEPAVPKSGEKKKKPVGRWDTVMEKISKSEEIKTNLKGVKSKVFDNLNVNTVPRPADNRQANLKMVGSQKVANSKLISHISEPTVTLHPLNVPSKNTPLKRPRSAQSNNSSERRRVRNRLNSGITPKKNGNLESSIHSSLSDLSAALLPPDNKTIGSIKKRNDVVQVTQVLTANKLTPRTQQQQNSIENKKNATHYTSPSKSRRNLFSAKPEKQVVPKVPECGRGTVKSGRTSPTVRQTQQQQQPQQTKNCQIDRLKTQEPRIVEGLAVLVQHLVFNVVPNLRKQVEKYRQEAKEIRLACQRLEETSVQEKVHYQKAIESERESCRNDIEQLKEDHRIVIEELTNQQIELKERVAAESENSKQHLCRQHEDQLTTLKHEFLKLQKSHEESLEILREENDAISSQVDEKREELEKVKHESRKLKEDYETREGQLKEHNWELERQIVELQNKYEERIRKLLDEKRQLREENDRLLGYGDDVGIEAKEVLSLRAVLDLKQTEISDLRKALEKATHLADLYKAAEERARFLNARCEDLELQLERKTEFEKTLINENTKLQVSFKEETNQNRRLSRHNEELRWKLEQNKEVVAKVIEHQSNMSAFRRSQSTSYYSAHSNSSPESRKELDFATDDLSPPTSPKVKGVVEKSDSVSYLLDLNERPEEVASRIVRRSFRNSTPPKNTPTKSPSNKRPRIRVPCSQSSSSSAIISPTENETERSHSASRAFVCESEVFSWSNSVVNSTKYEHNLDNCDSSNFGMKLDDTFDLDEDNEVDIPLPALPSELDRRSGLQALPTPKHLAGDCMISESNSEDESTSSSQL